jgi:hypothetical protein
MCPAPHKAIFPVHVVAQSNHIPYNTVHLSESCREDFGGLESDTMLHAQVMLSDC